MNYTIILFYKYIYIEDPELLRSEQIKLASMLDLKGRVIIAKEGINVTLEGATKNIDTYLEVFLSDPRFADTHIKKSSGTGSAFPKLSVRLRKEIVTLGKDYNSINGRGKKLEPSELKKWFETKEVGKDFHIVDLRNDYEFKVGRFKGSVMPNLQNFRDVPKVISALEEYKDKPIVTVCTGNVRCEKASGFLIDQGFEDTYHLDGGIVTYMEKYPAQEFEGSLYVFDKRIIMDFDSKENHKVIGICEKCKATSERYVNCKYPRCNKHFICCENCSEDDGRSFCGVECRDEVLVK